MKQETLISILNIEDSLEKLLVAKAIVLNTLPHAMTEEDILGVFTLCAEFLVDAEGCCGGCADCCDSECSGCCDGCCDKSCCCDGDLSCTVCKSPTSSIGFEDCKCCADGLCQQACECPCHMPASSEPTMNVTRVAEPDFNPVIDTRTEAGVTIHRVTEMG